VTDQPILKALDLFSGGGGSSYGAQLAGVSVVAAVDSWSLAKDTYEDNFPDATFFRAKCESLSPERIKRDIGHIDLLIASPECTSHTCAKGSAERSEDSKNTAYQVTRFARVLKPRWIIVENVIHMRSWDRYDSWLRRLTALGYRYRTQVLDSADFGVPQSRRRLFVVCDREHEPPEIVPPNRTRRGASSIIVGNGAYDFSPLESPRRAQRTLDSAKRAIDEIGPDERFLIVYYGTDGGGGWQPLTVPLRTVTTLDRFALVTPTPSGYRMRMLQVPELKKAMGLPQSFKLNHGTRRDQIKLLGNGVCPPVMRAIVQGLCRSSNG
jgi:DNA (cytosine-5)-methyltransferase 1